MALTVEQIKTVMTSSIGSMQFFKRTGSQYMDYTEGVMEFQRRCNAYWFVDFVYSHMPAVIKDFNETEETFYLVKLNVKEDNTAIFTITREVYCENEGGVDEVEVVSQEIPYTDFPQIELKFYLEIASYDPVIFRLLCPSEH